MGGNCAEDPEPRQRQPESRPPIAPRKRYVQSKVGCRTCKIRKIRCDETWPICRNCSRTGRRCDGVSKPANSEDRLTFTAPLTLSSFRPSQMGWLGQRELLCLDLFRQRLIYSIMGYVARPAWKQLILQAMHEDAALCHAVIAFSALDCGEDDSSEKQENSKRVALRSRPSSRFALDHYGKGITALRRLISQGDSRSINVALLCALLCICFELRMDDPRMCLSHLEYSLGILNSNLSSVERDICLAFSRLDLQATLYLGLRSPTLDLGRFSAHNFVYETIYQEADHVLTLMICRIYEFLRATGDDFRYRQPGPLPMDVIAKAESLESQLHRFHDKYLAPYTPAVDGEPLEMSEDQVSLLRIRYLTALIVISTGLHAEEAIYDRFLPQFCTLVNLTTDIMDRRDPSPPHQVGFSLDGGLIHPLYMAATKCRSPEVRRRAIELLYSFPGSEGAWEGAMLARISERVMEVEEGGLDMEVVSLDGTELLPIPEFRRIHSVDIETHYAEKYSAVSFRSQPNGLDGEWEDVVEIFAW